MGISISRSREVANNDVGLSALETSAARASICSGDLSFPAVSDSPVAGISTLGKLSAMARNVASKVILGAAFLGMCAEKSADAGFITSSSNYGAMADLGSSLTGTTYDPNRGFIGAIFVTDSQGNVMTHATVTVVTPTLGFVAGHTLLAYQGTEYTKTLVFGTNVLTSPTGSRGVNSFEFHPDYGYKGGDWTTPDIAAVHFNSVADIYGGDFQWKIADAVSPLWSTAILAGYDLMGSMDKGLQADSEWTGQANGVHGEIANTGLNAVFSTKLMTSYEYNFYDPLGGVVAKYGSGGVSVNELGEWQGLMVANNRIGQPAAWSYSYNVTQDSWVKSEIATSISNPSGTVPEPSSIALLLAGGASIALTCAVRSKRNK